MLGGDYDDGGDDDNEKIVGHHFKLSTKNNSMHFLKFDGTLVGGLK